MWLQLLIMTLVLMGFLLYKNQDRAREFILSFVKTEFVIAVEVATAILCPTAPLPDRMRPSPFSRVGCARSRLSFGISLGIR